MKLKQIRMAKGLSIPALSRLSGIPKRTIEDIEARGECRLSSAIVLAKALGVTLDELAEKNNDN